MCVCVYVCVCVCVWCFLDREGSRVFAGSHIDGRVSDQLQ